MRPRGAVLDSSPMTNRVLVLYAHPGHEASQANSRLRAAIAGLPGVTLHDLYETYPDFFIDVRREMPDRFHTIPAED